MLLIATGNRRPFSLYPIAFFLRRVLNANGAVVINMKKKRIKEEMGEKVVYRHVLHLSIFVTSENKGMTIERVN